MTLTKRSQETKQHIMDSALECFGQKGYDATGVAEICVRAEVSKGAFYHHFPSKHALFMELLNCWLTTLDERIGRIQSESDSIHDTFTQLPAIMPDLYDLAQKWLPLFLEFWTQSVREPEVWEVTIKPYEKYVQLFSKMIQQGVEEGSIHPVDAEDTSRIILSLAIGSIVQSMLDPKQAEWSDNMMKGMNLLFTGLERTTI
jgi:AcrR family transcriptional regulator